MEAEKSSTKAFTIRAVWKEGFANLKRRYSMNILVAFLTAIVVGGGYTYATRTENAGQTTTGMNAAATAETLKETAETAVTDRTASTTRADVLYELLANIFGFEYIPDPSAIPTTSEKYSRGVLSVFVNETSGSQSWVFGIVNGINNAFFKGRISNSVIIFLFAAISILIFVFVKNVIVIGEDRYFLEQRRYQDTAPYELLFPYKNKRLRHLSAVMLKRYLLQLAWNLTIVGGFIKHYEYLLIPYILAENPRATSKEAFALSKQLTDGEKWHLFLLDLTFLPLSLLSALTYNVAGLFFTNAYIECMRTECYMQMRGAKRSGLAADLQSVLNDAALAVDTVQPGAHPSGDETLDIELPDIANVKYDYMRSYSVLSLIQLFFTYAVVGWLWEVFLHLAGDGEFVNRGTMHGPWLPIYGVGGLLILVLLKPLRKKPAALFLAAVVVCGIVEYGTAWFLETFFHARWWSYDGYFLNLDGRICLEGLLVFGLAGMAFTYILSPLIDDLYAKIDVRKRRAVCAVLCVVFLIDAVYSVGHPNKGEGITDYDAAASAKPCRDASRLSLR